MNISQLSRRAHKKKSAGLLLLFARYHFEAFNGESPPLPQKKAPCTTLHAVKRRFVRFIRTINSCRGEPRLFQEKYILFGRDVLNLHFFWETEHPLEK